MAKYDWSKGPAEIEPHSLAKHTILRDYIERYVSIVTMNGTVPLRVTLVDGFSGGGEYRVRGQGEKKHDGSPIILVNAVRAAAAKLDVGREKPVEINADFVFIEKELDAYQYLGRALAERFDRKFLEEKVKRIHGSFEEQIDRVIQTIQSTRGRKPYPIFVLDQYGYSNVPIDTIAKIMSSFRHAEVFLTLAVDNIARFKNSLDGALIQLRTALRFDTSEVEKVISGRLKLEEVHELPEEDRNRIMGHIQCVLHEAFAKHSGAMCYTPFFITSTTSHRSYWFLHLANNARANDVVKQLHWETANTFKHHGRPGTQMLVLGVDPSKPPKEQLPFFDFGVTASECTREALIEELPVRLREERYRDGISVGDFYKLICNETPASKEIMKQGIDVLCSAGEFKKIGGKGEERRLATKVQDSDIICIAKQGRLFSTPSLRNKPRP